MNAKDKLRVIKPVGPNLLQFVFCFFININNLVWISNELVRLMKNLFRLSILFVLDLSLSLSLPPLSLSLSLSLSIYLSLSLSLKFSFLDKYLHSLFFHFYAVMAALRHSLRVDPAQKIFGYLVLDWSSIRALPRPVALCTLALGLQHVSGHCYHRYLNLQSNFAKLWRKEPSTNSSIWLSTCVLSFDKDGADWLLKIAPMKASKDLCLRLLPNSAFWWRDRFVLTVNSTENGCPSLRAEILSELSVRRLEVSDVSRLRNAGHELFSESVRPESLPAIVAGRELLCVPHALYASERFVGAGLTCSCTFLPKKPLALDKFGPSDGTHFLYGHRWTFPSEKRTVEFDVSVDRGSVSADLTGDSVGEKMRLVESSVT